MSQEVVITKEEQQPETDELTDSEKIDFIYRELKDLKEQVNNLLPVLQNLGNSPMGNILGSFLR